ncbi:MAG: lactonase family protein [Lentisphaeria bacterium]|nr:lactonase family protein [Lentisphaeria bacterium]
MAAVMGGFLVFVGTYTGSGSKGIYVFRFDAETGALTDTGFTAAATNPSFLALTRDGRHLYSVSETAKTGETPSGAVAAFRVDPDTGALTFLNQQLAMGRSPCHLSIGVDGKAVFVANYSSGTVAMLPLKEDGSLEAAAHTVQHEGNGPDPGRQKGPHAHSITPDPATGILYACDLGIDKVMLYRAAPEGILPAAPPFLTTPSGAGPRHLAFHPDGRRLYVVNELDSTVTVFTRATVEGPFARIETITTLPPGNATRTTCADIHVSPCGRFVYASNRGHDSIAVFAVDARTGTLTPIGHEPVMGKTPRSFAIAPGGKWLLAANQDSDSITLFQIDADTGRLAYSGRSVTVPKPVCVRFGPR